MSKEAKFKYSDEFENMIIAKAVESEQQGLNEGLLDEKKLRGIMVYINKIPALCLFKTVIIKNAPFLAGKTICARAETL